MLHYLGLQRGGGLAIVRDIVGVVGTMLYVSCHRLRCVVSNCSNTV